MEIEQGEKNQDVDLMPNTKQIISHPPPPPIDWKAPSGEEEISPLDEDLIMDILRLAFNELQKKMCMKERNTFLMI